MGRRATRFFVLLLLLGMVGCDHATKIGAKAALEVRAAPLDVVSGVLDLRYAENRDTAFSLTSHLHFARVVAANTFLPTGDRKPSDAFFAWRQFSQDVPEFPTARIIQGGCVKPLPPEVIGYTEKVAFNSLLEAAFRGPDAATIRRLLGNLQPDLVGTTAGPASGPALAG